MRQPHRFFTTEDEGQDYNSTYLHAHEGCKLQMQDSKKSAFKSCIRKCIEHQVYNYQTHPDLHLHSGGSDHSPNAKQVIVSGPTRSLPM